MLSQSGLPSPPAADLHRCSPASMNVPAPCIVHQGHYYHLPPGAEPLGAASIQHSTAVADLRKSAGAVVIKQTPALDQEKDPRAHVANQAPHTISSSGTEIGKGESKSDLINAKASDAPRNHMATSSKKSSQSVDSQTDNKAGPSQKLNNVRASSSPKKTGQKSKVNDHDSVKASPKHDAKIQSEAAMNVNLNEKRGTHHVQTTCPPAQCQMSLQNVTSDKPV